MPNISLTAEEKKRLYKINDAISWRVTNSISRHFNAAGKGEAFAAAPTPDEVAAQTKLLKTMFKPEPESTLGLLKATDIFMGVARRIGDDKELAALLPKAFDAEDVALLEKCEMKSLAALVRARL